MTPLSPPKSKRFARFFQLLVIWLLFLIPIDAASRAGGGNRYSGSGTGGSSGFTESHNSAEGSEWTGSDGDWTILIGGAAVIILGTIAGIIGILLHKRKTKSKRLANKEAILGRLKNVDETSFLAMVRTFWPALQQAWTSGQLERMRPHLSDGLMRQFETNLALMTQEGLKNATANAEILKLEILGAGSSGAFESLHVEIIARARDVEVPIALDAPNATAKPQQAKLKKFTEVWSFLRRPQAASSQKGDLLKGECPNCGAPITHGQTTRCEYCHALVNSGEFDWVLSRITQRSEWHGSGANEKPVEGIAPLQARDSDFCKEVALDRAAYLFWQWIKAQKEGNPAVLANHATDAFINTIPPSPANFREAAIGAIYLQRCESTDETHRFTALVKWRARHSNNGIKYVHKHRFTVSRSAMAHPHKLGLAHARCHACLGPLLENDQSTCEFCGQPINDRDNNWIIDNVICEDKHVPPIRQ